MGIDEIATLKRKKLSSNESAIVAQVFKRF